MSCIKKIRKKKNLVYTVNPLPVSLMNFVFNFGSLKPNDELAYIKSMVRKNVDKMFEGQKNNLKEEWIEIEINSLKLMVREHYQMFLATKERKSVCLKAMK